LQALNTCRDVAMLKNHKVWGQKCARAVKHVLRGSRVSGVGMLLWFPCPDGSTLTCMITYESLYKIPRPYCLEDEVMAMTSLSGLFRTSLMTSLFSYLGHHCRTSLLMTL
jgi:hypothetical protein